MTWYPYDTQGHEPHWIVRTFRKLSASVRWVILVAVTGLAIAAIVAIVVSTLFTAIQNGL